MRMKKIFATCAVFMLAVTIIGCGNDEYSSGSPSVIEEEVKANLEKARSETEEEVANRAKHQMEIAKAKAEAQKQYQNSEVVMNGDVGEVGVASTTRMGTLIPTYIYFPKQYNPDNTYPLVIMLAGFSADHNNGTGFDDTTDEMTKNGIMVVQYDIPGYGKSEESNAAYTLTNVKADALDVIYFVKNNYNIGKVGALGYDVGGRAVMEIQLDGLYEFDQVELAAPFCDTKEFINKFFGQKNWSDLRKQATDNGTVRYGKQEYCLQWFLDWDEKADSLISDYCKKYSKQRSMILYSTDDDLVNPITMQDLSKNLGSATICATYGGHSLGLRGKDSPDEVCLIAKTQSTEFMKDLID